MAILPLAGLRFSLVGPGRVGTSLSRWIVAGGGELAAVVGRSPTHRAHLATELGGRALPLADLQSEGEDLLLVTVADAALDEVAAALRGRRQAAVALHTCGSRGASALAPLAAGGTAGGSLHPLFPFPHPIAAPPHGLVLAIDGPAPAQTLARRLAAGWMARAVEVPEEARAVYHLTAVLAAGGLVTLLSLAADLARRGGLPGGLAPGFAALSAGALRAAEQAEDPADALTGPWERGDLATVERHLEAVARLAPASRRLVLELAREALRQRQRRTRLPAAAEELAERLASEGVP